MNKEEQYAIKVTDMERRILIKALTLLKEKQIKEDKNYDFIDNLIIKSCDAAPIRKKRAYEER